MFLTIFWLPILINSFVDGAQGSTITGRISLGTYESLEQVSQSNLTPQTSNNTLGLSGRFFLKATDIGSEKLVFLSDLRDRNDFFGQLDQKAQQLTNANVFQFNQLYGLYPGPLLYTQVGRFSVNEAGAVYTDGILQGVNISKNLRVAVFGGLNPKLPDQIYVQFNPNSDIYGAYLSYLRANALANSFFNIDTAAVGEMTSGNADRTYWYNNATYQWGQQSRANLLTYIDFVPNTLLQDGTLNIQQAVGPKFLVSANLFTVDVIQYLYLQSIRALLPSSPYRQSTETVRYLLTPTWFLEAAYSNGYRSADGYTRQESVLTSDWLRAWGRNWDVAISAGYRDNFISIDNFAEARINYFSDRWEFGLDEQVAVEDYKNANNTYHPIISELSISKFYDNSIFGTFSFQNVSDERVQLYAIFLKLTYRFGARQMAPIRDVAPPRGRL